MLLAPVAAFLLAATLIAVYWPARVEPDASRGSFDGAGARPCAAELLTVVHTMVVEARSAWRWMRQLCV